MRVPAGFLPPQEPTLRSEVQASVSMAAAHPQARTVSVLMAHDTVTGAVSPGASYSGAPVSVMGGAPRPTRSGSQSSDMGKRTKSSRACDDCRRKKIRCDIDSGASVCTPCQRMGTVCQFSRVQLKRGPSKRIRSYSDAPLPQFRNGAQLPGIEALLSWAPEAHASRQRAGSTSSDSVPPLVYSTPPSAPLTSTLPVPVPRPVVSTQPLGISGPQAMYGMIPSPDNTAAMAASGHLRASPVRQPITPSAAAKEFGEGFAAIANVHAPVSPPYMPEQSQQQGLGSLAPAAPLPSSSAGLRRESMPARLSMSALAEAASYADTMMPLPRAPHVALPGGSDSASRVLPPARQRGTPVSASQTVASTASVAAPPVTPNAVLGAPVLSNY